MTEDPVELTAIRIELDGPEAADALRSLNATGCRFEALQLAAYIEKLDREVDMAGALWAAGSQG